MATVATPEDLVRVKYSGRDFWTYFDDLKVQIQSKYGTDYNDFMESATGVMLLDIMSWACDTLSFYLDRQATDSYLSTVQTRTAAERLVKQLGYKMYGAVSHSVDLTVTLDQAWGFEVIIPEGFKFQGPNDLVFEAVQDVSFPASDVGPKTVSVSEGETKTEIFVSDGTKNQVFVLSGVPDAQFLAQDSVTVTIDGTVWEEKEFIEFEATDHYEVAYGASPPKLRFGDGVAGSIPESGAEINVEYRVSSGQSGFAASDTIVDVVNQLRISGNEIAMTITNPLASGGGSDGESIQHAQTYAPRYYRTRQVAVTQDDYESLASVYSDPQFGSVAKAQAVSSRSAAEDLYLSGQLTIIRNASDDPYPTVQTNVANIKASVVTIDGKTASSQNSVSEMETIIGTPEVIVPPSAATGMYLDADDTVGYLRSIKNYQDENIADATDIGNKATSIDSDTTLAYNKIVSIGGGAGSSQLTDADHDALIGWLTSAITNTGVITQEKNNIIAAAGTTKTNADLAIGLLNTTKGNLDTLVTNLFDVDTDQTEISTEGASIDGYADNISAVVVDTSATVNTACDNIYDHVDAFLSQGCKANLIEVPILVKDADGFYQEPSLALQRSLERYLEDRKEPTVTVKVMSGGDSLVAADMTITLGVLSSVVKSKAISTAGTIIDDILKDRDFGESLYRSQVTDALVAMSGVVYVNVTITGPVGKVNVDGNLVINNNEVITKGTITIGAVDA